MDVDPPFDKRPFLIPRTAQNSWRILQLGAGENEVTVMMFRRAAFLAREDFVDDGSELTFQIRGKPMMVQLNRMPDGTDVVAQRYQVFFIGQILPKNEHATRPN